MAKLMLSPRNRASQYHSHNFSTPNSLEKLNQYVFDFQKCPSQKYGFHHVPKTPTSVPLAMKAISRLFEQNADGKRQAEHFVVSLSVQESKELGIDGLVDIANQFCSEVIPDHQSCFAIHENTKNLHAHIIVNPVNYRTGHRLHKDANFSRNAIEYVRSLGISN